MVEKIHAFSAAFLIGAFILAAGCVSASVQTSASSDAVFSTFDKSIGELQRFYNPDGSCYYTSQIDVRNIGSEVSRGVTVVCYLVDSSDNEIDKYEEYFETIDGGDHKIFTARFDKAGCDGSYALDVRVI